MRKNHAEYADSAEHQENLKRRAAERGELWLAAVNLTTKTVARNKATRVNV